MPLHLGDIARFLPEWISVISVTLRNGRLCFPPVPNKAGLSRNVNPKLWPFAVFTGFIAYGILTFASRSLEGNYALFVVNAIFIISIWVVFGILVHCFCKIVLRGDGLAAESVSITVQLLAVASLVSALVATIALLTTAAFREDHAMIVFGWTHLVAKLLLLAVYFPISLAPLHHLGVWKKVSTGLVLAPAYVCLAMMLILGTSKIESPQPSSSAGSQAVPR